MTSSMRCIRRVLSVLALLLLAATQAAAAQITDASPEPDFAGYIVEHGAGSSYTNSVDVGKVTPGG